MDLTIIKGLGPARRDKLSNAGISDLEDLRRADLKELSGEVEIAEGVLEGFQSQATDLSELLEIEGLGETSLDALVEEGVRSVDELNRRDAADLAAATGLQEGQIRDWQGLEEPQVAQAAEHAQQLAEEAKSAGAIALEGFEDARVVLQEGIADAKVKFEDDVLAKARILPVKAKDDVEAMMEDLKGDVVILREEADTAIVRIEEEIVEGLPIFKEKVEDAGRSAAEEAREGAEEVRVRVQEIRDKRVLPEAQKITEKIKGLFSRD